MGKQEKTRQEVEAQLEKCSVELSSLLSEKDVLSRQSGTLRIELEQLEAKLAEKTTGATPKDAQQAAALTANVNERYLTPAELETLVKARADYAEARGSLNKISERLSEKEQQRGDLLQEKSRLIAAASVGEIIAYQNRLEQTKQTVITLTDAIARQQDIITTANETLSSNHDLKGKRAEILAEIAINGKEYTAKDLETVDKQIQSEASETEANRKKVTTTIADAKQTIAGLEVKLTAARKQLADLEAKGSQILQEFLTAEAEIAGEAYLQATASLEAAFRQLVALDKIMKRNGFNAIASGSAEALFIPGFNLTILAEKKHTGSSTNALRMINTAAGYREALQQDISATITRWKDSGISVI